MPLILVHGIISDHTYFDGVVPFLNRSFRVITYDRRGYGLKGDIPDAFDVNSQLEDVRQLIETVNEKMVFIVAHSAGCTIATALALKYPGRVQGLILLEPSYGLLPQDERALLAWNHELNRFRDEHRNSLALKAFSMRIGINTKPSRPQKPTTRDALVRMKKNLDNFMLGEMNDIQHFRLSRQRLLDIQCAVTVGISSEGADRFYGAISKRDAEMMDWPITIFPGSHNMLIEEPEQCSRIIEKIIMKWSALNES